MGKLRNKAKKGPAKEMKEKDLCNGPSKLCQALQIAKDKINKADMTKSGHIWLEDGVDIPQEKIVVSKRININYAEEWVHKPLRFYVLGNPCVSSKDKDAEKNMEST